MLPKDSFAAKLASGTALASKMASWWPRHCHLSLELLAACAEGREGTRGLEKSLIVLSNEWEASVPTAKSRRAGADVGLMVEHAVLEADLILAVLTNNASSVGRLADRMMDNAKVQGTRYAHALTGFPAVNFSYRIQEHVELFLEAVRNRFNRNAPAASKCAKAMDDNAVALAAIAAEWF